MYLNLGTTSLRDLEEFHYFREGFEFLYFCPRCCRNFETPSSVKRCRCGSAVRLLQQKEKHPAKKYNYFCEKCGKVESEKRIADCPSCKGRIAPVYGWDELNVGDRISIWLSKISSKAKMPNEMGQAGHNPLLSLKMPKINITSLKMPRLSFTPTFARKSEEE